MPLVRNKEEFSGSVHGFHTRLLVARNTLTFSLSPAQSKDDTAGSAADVAERDRCLVWASGLLDVFALSILTTALDCRTDEARLVHYSTVQHSVVQYSIVQYSTVLCSTV